MNGGVTMFDLVQEPDLGYVFYAYEALEHPGHPRMDVIIRKTPTFRHFDPKRACFLVVSHHAGRLEQVHVEHPWTQGNRYRVCAGRIYLSDRTGKRVEAFSLGGELRIGSDREHTVCILQSSAPIFALCTTHDLPMWITAEVEIILARQKAHCDPRHPHEFEEHLASVDPVLLYASCLQAIQDRPDHGYRNEDDLEHQGEHFVRSEIQRLQENNAWPSLLPTPGDLFRLEIEDGISY